MLNDLITLIIYLALATIIGFIQVKLFKKTPFGGLYGAMATAFLGAVVGGFAFDWLLCRIMDGIFYLLRAINWLMRNSDALVLPPINVIAAVLGSVLTILIFYKISPRKDP
jgi:uncharacterized membrane protein YeaQ/YmgE (transglycosylase-associated protein family)